jgi:ribosomal protein S18 acetylase RimI-like enzyme
MVVFLFLIDSSGALSSIRVAPVKSHADVIALAELRYNEWIAPSNDTDCSNDNAAASIPSRQAFRMATAELYQERKTNGVISLVAWQEKTPVGAAELSPIELQGALLATTPAMLYVTDVVTDRLHRRKGVAARLMEAVEQEAMTRGASQLLLHVKQDNSAALAFYRKLGYEEEKRGALLATLDVDRLAKNAGTEGQLLLTKALLAKTAVSGRDVGARNIKSK